jgi:hypothetical protein
MSSLFQSRKFWIAVSVFVFDIAMLGVRQFAPEWAEFVQQLLLSVNGLAAVVIAGIAIEDAGAKAGGQELPPKE